MTETEINENGTNGLVNTDERRDLISTMKEAADNNQTWYNMGETRRKDRFVVENDDDETWLTVYDLPHKDFLYNVENTRILAAREQWEAENPGKELSPVENKEVIEEFLKENPTYSKTKTKELAEELKKSHYMKDPVLIDEFGIAWNGNRRLAVVRMILDETGDSKYEKVPCCILRPGLTLKEKKRIESRLQVEKTFKEEYGTIELRLQIRKYHREGETWEQIAKNFGNKWKIKELKTNLEEINFVNKYLRAVNKSSDYDYISTKGSGSNRSGIEVFKIPFFHWRKSRDDLIGKHDEDGKVIPGEEASNPDVGYFKKNELMWFQQLHAAKASHDTTREHGKVMSNTQARKDYEKNDPVFTNYALMTTQNADGVTMAFTLEATKKALENTQSASAIIGKDVQAIAETARKNLERIENNEIPWKDSKFKAVITQIETEIKRINAEWEQNSTSQSGEDI